MYPVQYIVVRHDMVAQYGLNLMSVQIAHAAVAALSNQLRADFSKPVVELLDEDSQDWIRNSFVKIVLQVSNLGEMQDLMDRLDADGIKYWPIRESRLENQLTCIGLKPYNKGRVAPYFKGIPLLGGQ